MLRMEPRALLAMAVLYVELYSQIINLLLVVGVSCSLVSAKQSDRH